EMVGRPDVLAQRTDVTQPKARKVNLKGVIADPAGDDDRYKTREQTHDVADALDLDLIDEAELALESGEPVAISTAVDNTNRAVGATLSNAVSTRFGGDGLPDDTISCRLEGTAGQSFGAFLQQGITMDLVGTANDYVGKGLSGGKLTVRTPENANYAAEDNVVIGNVALYGATQGEAYVNGMAGERFAVRNSGVTGCVEGVGDHGCEYMTGGAIAVLGGTGKNFAAGMSGGVAYVYDPDGDFARKANTGMVSVEPMLDELDREMLTRLVENHAAYTDSERAAALLADWDDELAHFTKVLPDAYAEIIEDDETADVRTELPDPAAPTSESGVVSHGQADD
ncbi:glutamate synthase subunit alpha, partial [Halobacteriales archaeon QH_8_67_27]